MEEKLINLYNESIQELKSIDIDMQDKKYIGTIDIQISPRALKKYGYCKQEDPDKKYKTVKRYKSRKVINYQKFNTHHIYISKWVLELNDKVIKNTIIHELIHCIPYCNDHGKYFKKYATYINERLGYNISRLGNKKDDYKNSNIEYLEDNNYNYQIICSKCGQSFYRQRLNKNFVNKYRCGICKGKFKIEKI